MPNLDEVPTGWYAIDRSANVPHGRIVTVSFLKRELVLFRDGQGVVHALGAYCTHRGSHLGQDGIVLKDGITCRSHMKKFATDGTCRSHKACPPLGSLETREANGLIMAWHDLADGKPTYEPPVFAPLQSGRYADVVWRDLPAFRTHVAILLQDVFDNGHFEAMHGLLRPETRSFGVRNLLQTETNANVRVSRFFDALKIKKSRFGARLVNGVIHAVGRFLDRSMMLRINLCSEVHGLGLVAYETTITGAKFMGIGPGEVRYLLISAGTPTSPGELGVSLGIASEKLPFRFVERLLAEGLLETVAEGYEADRSRWEGQLTSRHQQTFPDDEGIAFFERMTFGPEPAPALAKTA